MMMIMNSLGTFTVKITIISKPKGCSSLSLDPSRLILKLETLFEEQHPQTPGIPPKIKVTDRYSAGVSNSYSICFLLWWRIYESPRVGTIV